MPATCRTGRQRDTDHIDPITATQQTVVADQHMRHRAHRAPRTSSTMPHLDPASAQNPRPGPPPRTQTTPTIRALQPASQQDAFDFQPIRSYNLHQCPRASRRTLPSPAKVSSGGFLRVHDKHCPTNANNDTNSRPRPTIPTPDVATPTARPQHAWRSTDLVQQEIWGYLCCHYAIRAVMWEAAIHAGTDPDRVSFVAALRIARRSIAQPGDFPPSGHSPSHRPVAPRHP
jgi:hypothetical protein